MTDTDKTVAELQGGLLAIRCALLALIAASPNAELIRQVLRDQSSELAKDIQVTSEDVGVRLEALQSTFAALTVRPD